MRLIHTEQGVLAVHTRCWKALWQTKAPLDPRQKARPGLPGRPEGVSKCPVRFLPGSPRSGGLPGQATWWAACWASRNQSNRGLWDRPRGDPRLCLLWACPGPHPTTQDTVDSEVGLLPEQRIQAGDCGLQHRVLLVAVCLGGASTTTVWVCPHRAARMALPRTTLLLGTLAEAAGCDG